MKSRRLFCILLVTLLAFTGAWAGPHKRQKRPQFSFDDYLKWEKALEAANPNDPDVLWMKEIERGQAQEIQMAEETRGSLGKHRYVNSPIPLDQCGISPVVYSYKDQEVENLKLATFEAPIAVSKGLAISCSSEPVTEAQAFNLDHCGNLDARVPTRNELRLFLERRWVEIGKKPDLTPFTPPSKHMAEVLHFPLSNSVWLADQGQPDKHNISHLTFGGLIFPAPPGRNLHPIRDDLRSSYGGILMLTPPAWLLVGCEAVQEAAINALNDLTFDNTPLSHLCCVTGEVDQNFSLPKYTPKEWWEPGAGPRDLNGIYRE